MKNCVPLFLKFSQVKYFMLRYVSKFKRAQRDNDKSMTEDEASITEVLFKTYCTLVHFKKKLNCFLI